MKLCSACKRDLPKESHSKKQWQSKQHQRRCKKCIADNKESQLDYPKTETSVPTTAGSNNSKSPGEGVSCWICLEEGADEKGQPLRRDCSCRGDSGYMHVSCVARYAEQKSRDLYDRPNIRAALDDEFCDPWCVCPNCNQEYQNELALEMATEFVELVDTFQQPQNHTVLVCALGMKCSAAQCICYDAKAMKIAKEVISAIEDMRKWYTTHEDIPIQSFTFQASFREATSLHCIGRCLNTMGTKNSAQQAVPYLEKAKSLYKLIGAHQLFDKIEGDITYGKSIYGKVEKRCVQSELKILRDAYDSSIKRKYSDAHSIQPGIKLAGRLSEANHGIEAERLATKVHSTCHRVHGPDHAFTKDAEVCLQSCKTRCISALIQNKPAVFQALQYTDGGEKCLIQGPITDPRNLDNEKKYKMDSSKINLAYGTPVVCFGLKDNKLNGEIGDLRPPKNISSVGAELHFEDESPLGSVCLSPEDMMNSIRILFDLPYQKEEASESVNADIEVYDDTG